MKLIKLIFFLWDLPANLLRLMFPGEVLLVEQKRAAWRKVEAKADE